jgi:hypothetical protein
MFLKHGLSTTPEYKCWQQIKARCLNPTHRAYPDYGGRGITVHPDWSDDFMAFYRHVGPRPSKRHSLDRLNNARGYEPGNVAWKTKKEQNNNRRPHRAHGVRPPLRPTRTDGKPTNFKHGGVGTPEYTSWTMMKDRCLNPSSSNYPRWGGRGIKICLEWVDDFAAFFRDVGPRPSPQHSLDRRDNEGDYTPKNCRWATKLEQTRNRRPCKSGPDHGNAKHGLTKTPEYSTWGSIKTRCFNPKHDGYARYGALGITMCERWRGSFEAFLEDLGPKPSKGHTILREDLEGHYSCGKCEECEGNGWLANCRWATRTEVNRHRRPSERSGKLDEGKVAEIRRKLAMRVPYRQVADEYGIGLSLVAKIKAGLSWA